MTINYHRLLAPMLLFALNSASHAEHRRGLKDGGAMPVLWQEPVDITTRDMTMGVGGPDHQPRAPFTFVKEELTGSNPKYVITDGSNTKWKIKLGEEAQPETAASRFVWAAGYFADEDYFFSDLKVDKMPANLHRGENLVEPDGLMHNVRLKRYVAGAGKEGTWKWKDNPFTDTREFNGLRVLMALINNWDLKDVNNSVYEIDGKKIYFVSDLGASFGTTGLSTSRAAGKGNLDNYSGSKFVTEVTASTVSFGSPSRPALINVFAATGFKQRLDLEWIGKGVPIDAARWIGTILARLSPEQIHAAFASAGYGPKEIEGFSAIVQQRIAELNRL